MDPEEIKKLIAQMTGIESTMTAWQQKANEEIEANGKITTETIDSITNLGTQQKEIGERLLALEQSGVLNVDGGEAVVSMGAQFINSDGYAAMMEGSSSKARLTIENSTTIGTDATVAPDRKMAIVPGAMRMLTLEDLLVSLPTSSNAIEYTREATFVNNAASVLESAAKPQTNITFNQKTSSVRTVAHWTKISKQLAEDSPALAAYINFRMVYGVNQAAEIQIATGDGRGANLSGLLLAANYTAHGIADAGLGSTLKKHVLIRKVIALLTNTGYKPDAILLNPVDFGALEIDALTATSNAARVMIDSEGMPRLFGLPIIQSSGITADSFLVGAFQQAATVHNRQDTVVELSDSDGDNFQKNLFTVRAERRLTLTVEVPAAIMGGDLTPA